MKISIQNAAITTLLIAGLTFGAAPALAVGASVSANQANKITNLQNRANNAIGARITSLNKLIDRIGDIKRLTADQKSTLTGQVQAEINNLITLKTKIVADTDLTTLRTDVQSIVKSFRVYVLFIPKTYIIAHADRILDVVSSVQTMEGKLQTRVTNAGNPSNLAALLTDMTSKLSDANSQAQNAINAVMPLTPEGWPGNQATLKSARTMLQAARGDIQAALKDAQSIRQGLKGLKGSPKPTASTTP